MPSMPHTDTFEAISSNSPQAIREYYNDALCADCDHIGRHHDASGVCQATGCRCVVFNYEVQDND